MKMSQREKYLLTIVGCILVGVLYYQFLYTSQKEKLELAKNELMEVQARHDQGDVKYRNITKTSRRY